jgi:protein O-GlcNAc transferase
VSPDPGSHPTDPFIDIPPHAADALRRAKALLTAPPDPRLAPLAIELCRQAWEQAPGHPEIAIRLARALFANARDEEARAVCREALAAHPEAVELRLEELLLTIPPVYADAHHVSAARAAYCDALSALEHHLAGASQQELSRLGHRAGRVFPSWLPYQGEDDAPLQRRLGSVLRRAVLSALPDGDSAAPRMPASRGRIRVGFVSSHFHNHTIWHVAIRGWLAGLTARGFQCYGYHAGDREDEVTAEARSLCTGFISGDRPARAWAEAIARDRPHAIVYPACGYSGTVDRLALLRLAPIQCATFGQCETSGSPVMDYFLSSDLMEPADGDRHYTERLVRLPDLGLSYPPRRGSPAGRGRDLPGLRPDAVVVLSPHILAKYLPQHDELYARIAAAAPDAQLVFFKDARVETISRVVEGRLRDAFAAAGVDPDGRLVFLDRLRHAEYLSLLDAADVYLDVPGWNGGTTTAEALVRHLPVVTLEGDIARSRMGAAMLRHLGVTDGLARTPEEYVHLATGLARDAALRQEIGRRLRKSSDRIAQDEARVDGLAAFLRTAVAGVAGTGPSDAPH